MVATTITFLAFANMTHLIHLQLMVVMAGATVFGGIVGIYALMAQAFLTSFG